MQATILLTAFVGLAEETFYGNPVTRTGLDTPTWMTETAEFSIFYSVSLNEYVLAFESVARSIVDD